MKNKLFAVLALAFSFSFGQAVYADSYHCGEKMKSMVESLKLDSAQKDKIKPIMDQLKSTMENLVMQMKDIRAQMKQQMESPNMDQGTTDGLIDKKTKIIGDMMKAKASAMNQIYNILNPQQKTELQEKMKKAEEKMEEQYKSCHDDDGDDD